MTGSHNINFDTQSKKRIWNEVGVYILPFFDEGATNPGEILDFLNFKKFAELCVLRPYPGT